MKYCCRYRTTVYIVFQSILWIANWKLLMKTSMWANAQRDGRPAEYRWRPLFNAAKFG